MMVHSVLRTALCVAIASLPLMAFGGPAPDTDGDGVPDVLDNCSEVANAAPNNCDSDVDGYGNACDADVTNDGLNTGADIAPFIAAGPVDQNCDGLPTGADIAPFIATLQAAQNPGPSGLPCAGSIPCQ